MRDDRRERERAGAEATRNANRWIIRGFSVAAIVGGLFFIGLQLQQHSQGCDPALRQCALTEAELAPLLGAWCNPSTVSQLGPVREVFRREGDRVMKDVSRTGSAVVTTRAHFVREENRISYTETDPVSGRLVAGAAQVRMTSADTRIAESDRLALPWMRCERMAQLGVSPEIVNQFR